MPKPALLVVDDDPDVLRAIARDLRRHYGQDYRVLRAASGDEALAALDELKERGDPVALLLSDQRMHLVARIEEHPKIEVRLNTEVAECLGENHLEGLVLETSGGERGEAARDEVETRYLFVFIGAAPRTDWLDGVVVRDERGFVPTSPDLEEHHLDGWPLERAPFLLEMNVPGIFVAGDVRHASVKRVASAVGEGSVAVHFMHRHLASL